MSETALSGQPPPTPKVVLCPYCGGVSKDPARCESCKGYFDPLSRQATQNSMGPWSMRDEASPFRPGCSFEVLRGLVLRGRIGPNTVLRGPTTNQFWSPARRVPGVANLLGVCHNCGGPAGADDVACLNCGATFRFHEDRQELGLTEVRLLPGQASPEAIAEGANSTAGATLRPRLPRMSAAIAPNPPPPAPVGVERKRSEAASRGVPKWVVLIAAMCVIGAVVAAAWIMGKLPGFPSPVLSPVESPAGNQSVTPGPQASLDAGANAAEGLGEQAKESPTEPVRLTEPGPEAPTGPAPAANPSEALEGRLDEARRLIRIGSPDGLVEAAKLASELGSGAEGAALKRAAEGLLTQRSLARLP